jgi:hypothetical protein
MDIKAITLSAQQPIGPELFQYYDFMTQAAARMMLPYANYTGFHLLATFRRRSINYMRRDLILR